MGGDVPLDVVLYRILVDEAVKDSDEVLRVLEVVHGIHEVFHAGSRILKDSVEVSQAVRSEGVVALQILDHFEEPRDGLLGLVLVL